MNNDRVIGKIFHEAVVSSNEILSMQNLGSNKLAMTVILQDVDTPNRNNRIYPKKVVESALNAPFILEKLATNSLAGEMNHPPDGSSLQRQMTIDMRNISHFIKKPYWNPRNSKQLLGDDETSGNSVGRDFAAMIRENNMICSFSMRGGGEVVRKNGNDIVKDPLKIITWDAVHFPSHKAAYMLNKLSEGIDVTVGMLTKYIAEKSENLQILSEDVECFTKDNVVLAITENRVNITDVKTGRLLGYSMLEQNLVSDYYKTLASIRNDI